ncbi:MAG: toxin-antitoxin system YwqK family antitoxin [Planctomycetota bacterium]|jgi:antitoxin component YwqK of YwqJK toxin-antitoxin module
MRYLIVLLVLSPPLLAGCASTPDDAFEAAAYTTPEPETWVIEEHWPDGSLKLRRTVVEASDGTLLDHGTYTKWHMNGREEYEATYVYGELHGAETSWHMNGQRHVEAHYQHGVRFGTLRSWDPEGRLRREETYFEGRPHGTWTIWTADGAVKWQATFEHGAVVDS